MGRREGILSYFSPERWQGERGQEELTNLRILLIWSLNGRDCSGSDEVNEEVGDMFQGFLGFKRKFDVLGLSETN